MSERVLSVSFDEDNITIGWTDDDANNDEGGTFHSSVLTEEGQGADEQVKYWVTEVRQSVEELLAQWVRYRRKK